MTVTLWFSSVAVQLPSSPVHAAVAVECASDCTLEVFDVSSVAGRSTWSKVLSATVTLTLLTLVASASTVIA